MSASRRKNDELSCLLELLCNDSLPSDKAQRLGELLEGDVEAQKQYVRYPDLQAALRGQALWFDDEEFAIEEASAALDEQQDLCDVDQEEVALLASNALWSIASETSSSSQQGWASPRRRTWLRSVAWTACAASVAAAAISAAVWTRDATPEATVVAEQLDDTIVPAELSGHVAARWAGDRMEFPEGEDFVIGQRLELIEGLAEVRFQGGARVVLQGPAIFQISGESSAVLTLGRIAAASFADAAFRLQTPVAAFTSNGAEFGVEVDTDGSVATQVFKGDLSIESSRWAKATGEMHLQMEQGMRIDASSGRIAKLERSADLSFVRYLPSRAVTLNLADVVAGGDGFSRAHQGGVSLIDGRSTTDYGAPVQGDGTYHRTLSSELIDGVFIPDGGLGPVQVDSIGRRFAGFPKTFGDCWSGVITTRRTKDEDSLPFIRLEFHGNNYGYVNWLHIASKPDDLSPEGHGLIGMHSNSGITFDLHAIRERNPNMKIVRFRALVGNLESRPDRFEAEAWVLVDGKLRYHRQPFSREDGPEAIETPLSDQDRFLVLAITDAGGSTAFDWAAFGDCVIEMQSLDDLATGSRVPRHPDGPLGATHVDPDHVVRTMAAKRQSAL